ncbi:MAG: ATP synthase F1 subunit gamma [Bacteroidota bacterium]
MPSIREIVHRISSVAATQQITKAMKMVAAAKLNKIQRRVQQLRVYAAELSAMLAQVISALDQPLAQHYTQERPIRKLLLVVMTSDKGLCGSFNSLVLKKVTAHIHSWGTKSSVQTDLLVIGRKALSYFKKHRHHHQLITAYTDLANQVSFEPASQAATAVMDIFASHTYDRVELVYNNFISVATQAVQIEQFLPIVPCPPTQGQTHPLNYLYEPSKAALVEELIPKSLTIQFCKALVASYAAEQGARMTTMGKATDNAEELLKSLRITYNRSRQAAITNEIAEIVAGAEALAV